MATRLARVKVKRRPCKQLAAIVIGLLTDRCAAASKVATRLGQLVPDGRVLPEIHLRADEEDWRLVVPPHLQRPFLPHVLE